MKLLILLTLVVGAITSANGADVKYTKFKVEVNWFLNHHSEQYDNFELVFNSRAPVLVLIKTNEGSDLADEEERIPIWDKTTDEIIQVLADKGFVKTLPDPNAKTTAAPTSTETTTTSSKDAKKEGGDSGSSGQDKSFSMEKEL